MCESLTLDTGIIHYLIRCDCINKLSTCGISSYAVRFYNLNWSHKWLIGNIIDLNNHWFVCILDIIKASILTFGISEDKWIFFCINEHSISIRYFYLLDIVAAHIQWFGCCNTIFTCHDCVYNSTLFIAFIDISGTIQNICNCYDLKFISSTTMISAHCINLGYLYFFHYRGICGIKDNWCSCLVLVLNLNLVFLSGKSIVVISNSLFYHVSTQVKVFGSGNSFSICPDFLYDSSMCIALTLCTSSIQNFVSCNGIYELGSCGISSYAIGLYNLNRSHYRSIFKCKGMILHTINFGNPLTVHFCFHNLECLVLCITKEVYTRCSLGNMIFTRIELLGSCGSIRTSNKGINHCTFVPSIISFSRSICDVFVSNNIKTETSTSICTS